MTPENRVGPKAYCNLASVSKDLATICTNWSQKCKDFDRQEKQLKSNAHEENAASACENLHIRPTCSEQLGNDDRHHGTFKHYVCPTAKSTGAARIRC